jgi:hypothetical protein
MSEFARLRVETLLKLKVDNLPEIKSPQDNPACIQYKSGMV